MVWNYEKYAQCTYQIEYGIDTIPLESAQHKFN